MAKCESHIFKIATNIVQKITDSLLTIQTLPYLQTLVQFPLDIFPGVLETLPSCTMSMKWLIMGDIKEKVSFQTTTTNNSADNGDFSVNDTGILVEARPSKLCSFGNWTSCIHTCILRACLCHWLKNRHYHLFTRRKTYHHISLIKQ